jgi:uncharacterized protein (TIGR03545 family)
MSLDPIRLISRKVIIEEMTMDKMAFHTPRQYSGAIARPPDQAKKSLKERFNLPSFDVPDVHEILEKEQLKTLQLAESIEKEFEAGETKWKQAASVLPNQEKFQAYRARLNELKAAKSGKVEDVLKASANFDTLRTDIKKEVDTIKQAEKDLKIDLQHLKDQVEAVTKAPQEDIANLSEKYSLTPAGLTRLTQSLFGGEVSEKIETGLRWYDKAKPIVDYLEAQKQKQAQAAKTAPPKPERFKGIDVRFREEAPLPDFLIRKILVSAKVEAGAFTGRLHDITGDQMILGRPMTFHFSGQQMPGMESFSLDGVINRLNPKAPLDQANLQIQKLGLKTFHLAKSEKFPVVLTHGMVNMTAKAVFEKSFMTAGFSTRFGPIDVSAGPHETNNPLVLALSSALMDVKKFELSAKITGTRDDYDMAFDSDLDQILKDAVEKRVLEQVALLKADLKEKMMEKAQKPIADLRLKLGTFAPILDDLTARGKIGDEILEKAVTDAKGLAEDKIKEEIKREGEKRKQELKNKVKEKLKLKFPF